MMVHTPWSEFLSESEQIHLLPIALSLTECFAMRHQEPDFPWVLKPGIVGFSQAQVPGERSWRKRGKSNGKNVLRNPLHNQPENLLYTWPVLTVFIDLILGTKKIKDRRTPTGLGNSYWGPADSGAFGTHWRLAPARVPQLHPLPLISSQGIWENKKTEIVKELRFC